MPMNISTEGMDDLSRMLAELGRQGPEVASRALYKGAKVMADEFTAAVDRIRTEPFRGKRQKRLPSPEEKAALAGKSGIAKFKKDGTEVDTLIGISNNAGYVNLGKRRTAVMEIARSINSGTSFMNKQPVFRKAIRTASGPAKEAIAEEAERLFGEIIKK